MQRTVKSTRFTYVVNEIDSNNNISSRLETITIHESNPEKALKKAVKDIGYFAPLKTEEISTLYILDDEIFFKYARIADGIEVEGE